MKLTKVEKDIIIRMIENELEYYNYKEDFDKSDALFVQQLRNILNKLSSKN